MSTSRRLPVQASDLRGLSRLATDATVGIVDLVERMHHTIARGTGIVGKAPQGSTTGVTGLVYRAVRGGARLTGRGLDALLAAATQWLPGRDSPPAREAALAALNGVWGDHLEATGNPLAIPMTLRLEGRALALDRESLAQACPQAGGRLLVLVHGLCMNDLQWQRDGHDHGQALAQTAGWSPVYLHYNSGRHVSSNGRDFARLLQQLVENWPVPVQELAIVGHSMGGLVTRSALHVAMHDSTPPMLWPQRLTTLVFLGTPHHGAPLERGGQFVDRVLGLSPYVTPFARLGHARSAGITDLRFGNLQDADWQGRERHTQRHDDRRPTPLPPRVAAYCVAATTAESTQSLRSQVLGDGLVRIASALGHHRNPNLALGVPPSRQRVVTGAHHWDLLSRPEVDAALQEWLA